MASEVQATDLEGEPAAMVVQFVLPKGAYATTFLSCACELIDASCQEIDRVGETSHPDELFQHPQFDPE